MWQAGDRLKHRHNPELGPGVVASVEGRTLVVAFPHSGEELRLAADSDALEPLILAPGAKAIMTPGEEPVVVAGVHEDGSCSLADGRRVPSENLWPLPDDPSPLEKLARGEVDRFEDVALRLDALHLRTLREAEGLGSFLGGRIELFPHQLYVAERATRRDPVRWLLADEVGLGKTVEACLVAAHLLRTGRASRTLVVAPETLTVQWLGELWRKYHHVFVLLDEKRRADIARELGTGFNPFEAHERMVISTEAIAANRKLAEQAAEAEIDLLIVDEAHHLRRPEGHPGNPSYRAIEPIAARGRHVLLLTATPLEDDAHGFLRLVELLRPDAFPDGMRLTERIESGEPLPACTSVTRRVDLGGLPPRMAAPVDLPPSPDRLALEDAIRAEPAGNAALVKRKGDRLQRALASGAAIGDTLGADDGELRRLAESADATDPRIDWLAREGRRWRERGEKTLVFCAHRASLELLRRELSVRGQLASGVFHEDLSPAQRDIEAAQFRLPSGPPFLIATECGGEGRNFQFCHRLVLFDMPWNPVAVEQRIGRLDRIGRKIPVEIVYFRPAEGVGAAVARLYEAIGLFEMPLAGLDRELADAQRAVEEAALAGTGPIPEGAFDAVIEEAREAESRVAAAAYHELHREPYKRSMAHTILARVPEELDELTQEVIVAASDRLRLKNEEMRGGEFWAVELGSSAKVESLPGVPAGSSFVGTFSRELAVENENDDFFAAGHPFVEGVLAQLDDSSRGRVGLLHLSSEGDVPELGIAAFYQDGPHFEVVCVDGQGRARPEWGERLAERPLRSKRIKAADWTAQPGWEAGIRRIAAALPEDRVPDLVLLVRFG